MNSTIEQFTRKRIKEGLKKLPVSWEDKFNRMYGNVNTMDSERLDLALTQVENSIKNLKNSQK